MNVIVDANILFAALLKDGMARRLMFNPDLQLYAPEFIVREFLKHRAYLLEKYAFGQDKFGRLLSLLVSSVRLIPDRKLEPFLPAAHSLIEDPNDWLYLAAALRENAVIWSEDKGMKMQSRVKVYTTKSMAREFGLL